MRVVSDQPERIQVGTSFLDVQRYDLLSSNPGGDVAMSLTAGDDGRLIRLTIPAQAIDVVREDVASPTSRTQVFSNPGDEAVIIPAAGFNLGATITTSRAPARRLRRAGRCPPSSCCRDPASAIATASHSGVPTLAQLAGAIADAGFLAVRYDKRGFGQSGGRSESATIQDYAEDVRAVVRWLQQRKDVDPETHRGRRSRRRRMGGAARRRAREANRRGGVDCRPGDNRRRAGARAAAASARSDEADARGARKEGRAAEADSDRGASPARAGN